MRNLNIFLQGKTYNKSLFFLTVFGLCLMKIMLFSLSVETPEMGWEWELKTIPVLLLLNASLLVILLSPLFLFSTKNRQICYGTLVNAIISIIIIGNRIYNLFFHSYLTPETFFHSHEALSMRQALLHSTVRLWELLWILDIILLLFIFGKMPTENEGKKKWHWRLKKFFQYVVAGLFIFAFFLNMHEEIHFQQNINLRENGLLPYYLRETIAYAQTKGDIIAYEEDITEIEAWFKERQSEESKKQNFGILQGKNLIILQVEALQNVVINKRINGFEITPNLNRIITESLYFSRCYDQVDMATADAEILLNLSLYPLTDVSVYMRYPDNTFNSLAHTLKKAGYRDAAVYHGFQREFYNRKNAYPNMGFDKYFSRRHYVKDEVYGGLLGDKTFLCQTARMLNKLEKPFYAQIITLTSHHPFNYLKEYEEIDVGDYEDTIVGDYIKSIHYVDAAIGDFYRLLTENGLMENSLLVILGDHVAFNYNEIHWEALNDFFKVDMQEPVNRMRHNKVPLILTTPNRELTGVIRDVAGQIDIFPTVINLLGIENDFLMGRDLLNTPDNVAILKQGSFVTGDVLYYAPTRIMINLETDVQKPFKETNELFVEVEKTLHISRLIHQVDYFQTLEERN